MNKYMKIVIPLLLAGGCLAALLVGLGGMARAEPLAWTEAEPIPYTWVGNGIQCPDDPDHFYLVGGRTAGGVNVDYVSRYDVITDTWKTNLAPLPSPNPAPALTCYQGKIYATYGFGGGGLLIYDIASDTWSSGASLPDTPAFANLGTWDGKLYLAGGSTTGDPWVPEDDVHVYDIASDTWTLNGATSMPVGAALGGSFQAGPYLYVVGGLSGDYDQNITVTQRYNMSTGLWELGPNFTSQRAATGLVRTEGYLYAIGGDANGGGGWADLTDYVERLDLTVWPGGAWTDIHDPLPDPVLTPGSFCTEALTGGEIWAVGGAFMIDNNLYRPAEACYDFYFGDLAPESLEGEGYRGATVSYDLTLHNDGTLTDTFDISISGNLWVTTAPTVVGPLAPGESGVLSVTVEVPYGATLGDMDVAQVSAASQGDPGMQDRALITTTAVTDWVEAARIPEPRAANLVQCPDDPQGFYLVGGRSPGGTTDTLYHYDAATNMWDDPPLATMPEPLRAVAVACYQGKIYAAGGWYPNSVKDTFYIYDIDSDSWSSGPSLPDRVWGAGLGAWDGKLYLVGGTRFGSPYQPVNRVDVYDLASGVWIPGGGTPMPTPASFYGSVQRGPYLYTVGGYSGNFNNNVNQTQRYDMSSGISGAWEIGPEFTSRRAIFTISMTDERLYAQGGDLNGGGAFDLTDLVEYLDLSGWPGGSWTDLGDPLLEELLYPAGACTEAMVGGEIWAVGGLLAGGQNTDANLYRPAEPCLGYNFSPELAPEIQSGEGLTDTTVTYALTLTNTGDTPDAFDLSASSSWMVTVSGLEGALVAGESVTLTVSVEIPAEAMPYEMDTTTITAASQGDPAMIASAILTTTVLPEYGLEQMYEANELSGYPGEMVAYSLTLSNTGTFTDTFDLMASGNTWEVGMPVMITLGAGEMVELAVYVTIPMDAMQGDTDIATITAASQGDPGVQAMADLTTTAIWHSTYLPLIER